MPPLVRFDTRNQPKLDVTTPIMQGMQMKAQQQSMTLQRRADERAEASAKREIEVFSMAKTKAERDTKVNLLTDFRDAVTTADHTSIVPLIEEYVSKGLPRSMFPKDLDSVSNPLGFQKFQVPAALGTKFFEKQLDAKKTGWKPQTKEEAIAFKQAGLKPTSPTKTRLSAISTGAIEDPNITPQEATATLEYMGNNDMSEAGLTSRALKGDEKAKSILNQMQSRKVEIAKQTGAAGVEAKTALIDVPGVAQAILDGRETIENVRNTFGVAVQELVRAEVLDKEPKFNFLKPRVKLAAIKSSLMQQEKQRGAMGSFVKNLNKQLTRIDVVLKDVISRIGLRALDLPFRELNTRFKGSGHEKVLESYLMEISNEIGKLSTGSSASVAELSTEAQQRWAKVHDPNLSYNELKKVLEETQIQGNMRMDSVNEQINETLNSLDNLVKEREPKPKEKSKKKSRFKIIKVN